MFPERRLKLAFPPCAWLPMVYNDILTDLEMFGAKRKDKQDMSSCGKICNSFKRRLTTENNGKCIGLHVGVQGNRSLRGKILMMRRYVDRPKHMVLIKGTWISWSLRLLIYFESSRVSFGLVTGLESITNAAVQDPS